MRRYLYTGGEIVEISSSLPWVWDIVSGSASGEFIDASAEPPTVTIDVERAQTAFRVRGWEPLTRGAWRRSDQVVIEDCCATGSTSISAASPTGQSSLIAGDLEPEGG